MKRKIYEQLIDWKNTDDLYHPKYMIRISAKDFGYDPKTNIKSIPLYATFLIKDLIN